MGFKDSPVIFLIRKTWEFSRGNRKNVVLYFILFIIANIINFFDPLIIGKILNIIQEQGINNENIPTIIMFLSFFIVLSFLFWVFHGPARVIETKNAFLARANYKKYLLEGTIGLPTEWHTDHHSGDTIDKIEKATRGLFDFSSKGFIVVETLVRLITSYFALVFFNLHSAYIVIFMIISTVTLILKFDKILIRQYQKLFYTENIISAKIFDIISNITTVIILRVEKLVSNAIFKKIMSPFYLFSKNIRVNEVKWFIVSMCSSIMMFLVLFSYIFFNFKKGAPILAGSIFILYEYVRRINDLFFEFAYHYGDIIRQNTAVKNVEVISDEFKVKKKTVSNSLDYRWNKLRIESLNFSYHTENGSIMHLNNISFSINRNERVALIGESGSGKTTLLKIIRELYNPKHIHLYLDGKRLKGGFSSISSEITLIPQDPEIFSSTIKDNITLGVNHNFKFIKKFTDMACFTDVIGRLPKKINSSIVEKGVNLSGGEKQRLALARGLLASIKKPILLLDEPTSSVDIKNELIIYKNIFREFKDKTIISSIHRLHLLPLFDRIYYFKDGKIIADGSLDELLSSSYEFRMLWEKQGKNVI